jgi:hypothetical protein
VSGAIWRRFRKATPGVALAVWAATSIAVAATLMVGHLATLPTPEPADPELREALSSLRDQDAHRSWLAVHVLYSKCRCSQRVFDHLFESERPPGMRETILLVGADAEIERRAAAAGFGLVVVTPQELEARFHMSAAPLLLVLDPNDAVRYAGGYTDRKQAYEVLDLEILHSLLAGKPADQLPLFGCGVTKELQRVLDPLGLKYS